MTWVDSLKRDICLRSWVRQPSAMFDDDRVSRGRMWVTDLLVQTTSVCTHENSRLHPVGFRRWPTLTNILGYLEKVSKYIQFAVLVQKTMSFPWFAACRVLDFGPCTQILVGRDCMTDGDMLLNLLAHIIIGGNSSMFHWWIHWTGWNAYKFVADDGLRCFLKWGCPLDRNWTTKSGNIVGPYMHNIHTLLHIVYCIYIYMCVYTYIHTLYTQH